MDKFVPECKPLKLKYDECLQEWVDKKVFSIQFGAPHQCSEKFEDYKDCVTIGMKLKNKQGKNESK